jgi:nitrite reductase (NADH) small subunit
MPENLNFLCRVDEVEEGKPYSFPLGRIKVVLVRKRDSYYALNDSCPHRLAPLSAGGVAGTALPSDVGVICYGRDGEILRCPWHGWEFDLLNGRSLHDPQRERVRAYPVKVEDGSIYVDLSGRVG